MIYLVSLSDIVYPEDKAPKDLDWKIKFFGEEIPSSRKQRFDLGYSEWGLTCSYKGETISIRRILEIKDVHLYSK